MKNKIKNIGRKYIAPLALAGALALSSYGCNEESKLPITQETKTPIISEQDKELKARLSYLENLSKSYYSNLDSARNEFNNCIRQGDIFTIREQEYILDSYKTALKQREDFVDYVKKERIEDYTSPLNPISEEDNRLCNLLDRNLNKYDTLVPELEKELRNSGLNLPVERKCNPIDIIGTAAGILISLLLFKGLSNIPHVSSSNYKQ